MSKVIPKEGIDISKHQGDIDFEKVKADGVEFVIFRSSYRQTTDPKFFEYVEACRKAGIPTIGVYHFIYALNKQQALEEAKFCIEQVQKAQLNKEDIVIFSDFEYDSVNDALEKGVVLGKRECNEFTTIFCDYIKSQGYEVGVYTNQDFYKNWYISEVLNAYNIWLADYNGEPNYECLIQQYTSKGRVNGIKGNVDRNRYFGNELQETLATTRRTVVNLICSWEGKNESDGTYKDIIDIYNSYTGTFPRGVKMDYNWAWCACTWSAIAIKLGFTQIMPIEISCGYLIEAAKKMGIWKENDGFIPRPGDGILYDWNDNGNGDNTGWPDHIGVVIEVYEDAGYFVVMEGNYNNAVKRRTISINGKYIRGFITPKYDDNTIIDVPQVSGKTVEVIAHEVIAGLWDKGEKRKKMLEAAGYVYKEVQSRVNEILNGVTVTIPSPTEPVKTVEATCFAKKFDKTIAGTYKTTGNLYCRNDAGTNKKALCVIPKGTEVRCYGYYNVFNDVKWYYIQFILDGIRYTGFSSSVYLEK